MEALADFGDSLPAVVILLLWAFIVVWSVFLMLLPFFVYGAWRRAKEVSEKMDSLIRLQHLVNPMPKPQKAQSKDDRESPAAGSEKSS